MNGDITFNSNDLQTDNIITNAIDHTNIPEKVANLYQVANANKSAIPGIDYPSKTITISGVIKGIEQVVDGVVTQTAQNNLDTMIDTFKGYLNGKEKNLDINYGGSTRRYIATQNTVSITRSGNKVFAPFKVEFICTQPFGIDTTATVITNTVGHTSATLNMTPTIAGTAPYQLPVFTITLTALTGTGDYIMLSNSNNGQEMLIYGYGLKNGDVLVIDCVNRIVTLNGVLIDYNGVFLELEPGANALTYTDGFTTRTVTIYGEYYKRYL